VRQLAVEVAPFLHIPRPGHHIYREPVTDDANRVALLLAQCANPHTRLDNLAMAVGVCAATLSNQLQWDRTNLLQALRGEFPALVHPDVLRAMLPPMGTMVGARLLVDTIDTKIQDLIGSFNVHHMQPTMKSFVVVDRDANLIGVEVGFGGAESDLRIMHSTEIYQELSSRLLPGERLFVGDGAFRDRFTFYPLSEKIDLKGLGAALPAFKLYNRQLQL
jgi:hypothetical protein